LQSLLLIPIKLINMRANKLILLSSILFGFILLFGCEESEGPTGPANPEGPQGEQGPEGPQGLAGNANVTVHIFDGHDFSTYPVYTDADVFYLISKVNPMQLKISGNII